MSPTHTASSKRPQPSRSLRLVRLEDFGERALSMRKALAQIAEKLTVHDDRLDRLATAIAALENRLTSVPHN
jgi:hypothetical protein